MKINSTKSAEGPSSSGHAGQAEQSGNFVYSTKNFYTFPPGTCFKALILDIRPGKVTIRLDDDSSFTARSMVLPDAHIGEESYFRVKANNLDGLIQLEMLKDSSDGKRYVFDMRV